MWSLAILLIVSTLLTSASLWFLSRRAPDTVDGENVLEVNEAGKVSADQLHETLLVLLQSKFAAVATTYAWTVAVSAGETLPKSDLGNSATQGRAMFGG